jgi:hypothetical protein
MPTLALKAVDQRILFNVHGTILARLEVHPTEAFSVRSQIFSEQGRTVRPASLILMPSCVEIPVLLLASLRGVAVALQPEEPCHSPAAGQSRKCRYQNIGLHGTNRTRSSRVTVCRLQIRNVYTAPPGSVPKARMVLLTCTSCRQTVMRVRRQPLGERDRGATVARRVLVERGLRPNVCRGRPESPCLATYGSPGSTSSVKPPT